MYIYVEHFHNRTLLVCDERHGCYCLYKCCSIKFRIARLLSVSVITTNATLSCYYGCTRFDYFKSGRSWIWPDLGTKIRPDPDSVRTRFSDHGIIHLMKLMVSTMLSAPIKRQCSSVLPLLHHCLPVFDEISGTAMSFVFFVHITLIKIVNTPLDR